MSNVVKDYFDNVAETYEHIDSPRIDELLSVLDLPKYRRILDLASGKGIISSRLQEKSGGEVVALDISIKMSEVARNKNNNPYVKVLTGDFYQFEDQPFDLIIVFDAYPHFLDKEAFVKKCLELLNVGGTLAIIHDIGRDELNSHHKQHAIHVSRPLDEPIKEADIFLPYFELIKAEEDKNSYKIILKKK